MKVYTNRPSLPCSQTLYFLFKVGRARVKTAGDLVTTIAVVVGEEENSTIAVYKAPTYPKIIRCADFLSASDLF